MQSPEKKQNQHHVWQEYLRAWTTNGQLYCLMGNRIFATGTRRLAVGKHFYKIGSLTAADIAVIRFLVIDVKGIFPQARRLHEELLRLVAAPLMFEGRLPELDDAIDIYRTNALEDYHSSIEASFLPLLQSALRKDISFYEDDQHCITLTKYLATQHMRTKGIKTKTIEVLKKANGFDLARVWDLMAHMYATNIGMGVFLERKKRRLSLVENNTDKTFITGDQPIINLHGDGEKSPDTLSWYYPISPRVALLLPEVDEVPAFTTGSLTAAIVDDLNVRILAASHDQVFADSRAALESYLQAKDEQKLVTAE